jgi:hypothetical protein
MIRKQNMEISFEAVSPGLGIQNAISDLFYEQLLPELNTLFDDLAGDQYLISADRIEIDCGLLSAGNWKDELIDQTLKKLKLELTGLDKKQTGADAAQQELQKDCLFFLEHGYLPWNSLLQSPSEFEEIQPDASFIEKIKELLRSTPKTAERLVYQFSDSLREKLIRWLVLAGRRSDLVSQEKTVFLKKDAEAVQLIVEMISNPEKDLPVPSDFKKEYGKAEPKQADGDGIPETEPEGIYIDNAGLVILHPFLPELFKRLGFWRDKQWVEPGYQHDAVYVLGYLLTGNSENPEFDMMLNKIMCGIQTTDVLLPFHELLEAVRTECDELLMEVVRHWTRLKNTSIAALRETFLQRDGKLTRTDHGWLLRIERKGVDVLLGSLPWGIGTIKLPWTDDKLFVEW